MTTLHHRVQGQGPLLVFSHALGCDLHMWDSTVAHLTDRYTVVCYDHRGHGQSPGGAKPFTMDDLADDAADLIDHLGLGPAHFVGVSMGGMTAQALAARTPHLVRSIVVANAASHYSSDAQTLWQQRIQTVLSQGMAAIADGAMQRWFTPGFRATASTKVAALREVLLHTTPTAYAHACAAVAGIALEGGNHHIRCPALVVAGSLDEATPPALSADIAGHIPGAQWVTLETAHLGCVEQPERFAALVEAFVSGVGTPPPR